MDAIRELSLRRRAEHAEWADESADGAKVFVYRNAEDVYVAALKAGEDCRILPGFATLEEAIAEAERMLEEHVQKTTTSNVQHRTSNVEPEMPHGGPPSSARTSRGEGGPAPHPARRFSHHDLPTPKAASARQEGTKGVERI